MYLAPVEEEFGFAVTKWIDIDPQPWRPVVDEHVAAWLGPFSCSSSQRKTDVEGDVTVERVVVVAVNCVVHYELVSATAGV